VLGLVGEVVLVNPGLDACLSGGINDVLAVVLASEMQPDASKHMTRVDNSQNENHKGNQVILSLLGVLLQQFLQHQAERFVNLVHVDESEELKWVPVDAFIEEDHLWDGSNEVEDKVSLDVIAHDLLQLASTDGLFDEVEDDFDGVDDVNGQLNLLESLLLVSFGNPNLGWTEASVAF
jgi:hypothetical protein